jgi:hypothetical protein
MPSDLWNLYECNVIVLTFLHVLHLVSIKVKVENLILNSVAWVRERNIPTERPPLVGEVSANFCG